MLPDFPELKQRLIGLAEFDFHQRVRQDGLLGAIKAVPYFEGNRFRAKDVDGFEQTTEPTVTAIPISFERAAIIERGIGAFAESLVAGAELQKQKMWELFRARMDEITERTGNRVDAGGQPFSGEMFLKLLETTEIEFDDDGKPDLSSRVFVVHPDMAEPLQQKLKEMESDSDFQAKYGELMRRKWEEWRDRESNRKLVD